MKIQTSQAPRFGMAFCRLTRPAREIAGEARRISARSPICALARETEAFRHIDWSHLAAEGDIRPWPDAGFAAPTFPGAPRRRAGFQYLAHFVASIALQAFAAAFAASMPA